MKELFCVLLCGSVLYGAIELLYRGRTHWTMLLSGGVCFLLLYALTTRTGLPLVPLCLLAAALITAVELLVGCLVNRGLHLGVWDYSAQRGNLLGQVCPLFSLCWFALCFPGAVLCGVLYGLLH